MEEVNQQFLHGTLEATIFDATPYAPPFPFNCFANGKPTYVTIKINKKKVAKTSKEQDRVWNQTFQILCAHPLDSTITITLKTKCSILGKFHIKAQTILTKSTLINGFHPLIMENGKPTNPEIKLRFMLWFKPAEFERSWSNIIRSSNNDEFQGLRNATFPQRSNCHVTLYQDAHHLSTFNPPFGVCGTPRRLWEDVYKAIDGAKHLVCIAGWSFNPKLVLVRDPETDIPEAIGIKLGELLKRKAEEGVAVRIMIWDDETSLPIIKNKGVMRTHDQDAFSYFKHTKVICKLCPRLHNKLPTFFTHHQKTITLDTRPPHHHPLNSEDREIMSFIGGLDLCDGRFDTEQHSLFQTLNQQSHCTDFYQTNIPSATLQKGGPREPWHDTHACILGDAAWDILTNFEQRWTKLCDPFPISNLMTKPSYPLNIPSERNWKVQVFRSIDHVSTQLGKNMRVETSIHQAYVEAIRRAERFIYIENQYFIGGCDLWDEDKNSGCRNLIPIEIALKIVSKIKAKERFSVYILIPMWPEGVPESEVVEDILHWSRKTMGMMYKMIGRALEESGYDVDWHPRDYLNFYCLANREKKSVGEFVAPHLPHPSTQYWYAQMHRRFMVYVHSKLMIVDDAYIIIGSANVNQRSMDGKRDTEIAIGCYQPQPQDHDHQNKYSTNDIQAYRMSLWYEHTGLADEIFLNPQSLECVHKIYSLGEKMWKIYSGEKVVDMEGVHLVNYPVNIRKDGVVEDINNGHFPDTKCPVKGRRSKVLPPIFTT
ncbi:phospholipase D alpha 4 [Euphorbia lathyris]|uniref:phospholipase D alpha 4 n=1 Tax=Euphorbia lathyris TaxID=212925 RepID=UPI003313D15A